jgi:RimJ/RimL family protein N-acetyltransferase
MVIDKEREAPIGFSTLFNIDWIARKAEFGIIVGDKRYWSRGYGGDATSATLSFAFDDLGLHRVYLNTYSYNPRAIRCYEKCGFRHEGAMRQGRYRHGAYHDIILMGILRDEFFSARGRSCD